MPSPTTTTPLPHSFLRRKALILSQLSLPADQYDDLSPKGSIDEGIRDLIEGINAREGWVTTSSCAGRVSVFVEGEKGKVVWGGGDGREEEEGRGGGEEDAIGSGGDGDEKEQDRDDERKFDEIERTDRVKMKLAGAGGKGGGGRWLFVSHEPVDVAGVEENDFSFFLGMRGMSEGAKSGRKFTEERLIHFKFEPMILHILAASLSHAQAVLKAALQAGFRESGALSLTSTTGDTPTPMVAVRSTGLALDSVIGCLDPNGDCISIVPEIYLEGLLIIANMRFEENSRRIAKFRDLLLSSTTIPVNTEVGKGWRRSDWEDASVRRERKRAEGMKRSQQLKDRKSEPMSGF